jgi:hypothetical protein
LKIALDEQPHGWKNNLVRYIKRADGLGKQCKEMGMRILIIEDDKELSYEIKEGLEKGLPWMWQIWGWTGKRKRL